MSVGGSVTQQINIKANLDISQAKGGISALQGALSKLSLPKGMENSFNKVFQKMKTDVSQLETLMQKGLTSKADVSSFNKMTNEVDKSYSKILTMISQLDSKKISVKVDTAQVNKLEQELEKAKQAYQDFLKNSLASQKIDTFGGMLSSIEKISTSSKTLKTNLEGVRGAVKAGDFAEVSTALNTLMNGFNRLGAANKGKISELFKFETQNAELKQFGTTLSEVFTKYSQLNSEQKKLANQEFKNQINTSALDQATNKLNVFEAETKEAANNVNTLNAALAQEKTSALDKAEIQLKNISKQAEQAAQSQQKANQQAQQNVAYQYDKQMQVNDLRMQVQYFFGLQNMIRLFRRGVSDAINTVKELDKAMTATAVVTDFSVGDMWGQLPEYTKRAQQLGTTIADMYNATTLYYQQGLDTEHAMGTAVETLKMARIAGIEGAEATDLMTAALRGFRMESNEVNASHVNDVYSALAASSASNTYEIGTAMSKVASLASSANMDLETTATFLAQIIETTREAPETAGTALKTIIARFGEVKKLGENGLLTGTDEEGEVIDINKVDTALKTAGISLQDFINGNEGLDQVFLRLAERWDNLSVAQQRYIATQAAGARMQARFIAMMQDYGRTQELLGIATNAEGAGEKQFGKVSESLEYKINQLKDAYHSFIMGIANSSAIKTVVDLLSTGFNAANTAIQAVSKAVGGLNGSLGAAVKMALSLGTAFAALKIGGKVLNTGVNILGSAILGKSVMSTSKAAGGGIWGLTGAKATAITKPILGKLDALIAVTKIGNKNTANLSAKQATGEHLTGTKFLDARKEINKSLESGKSLSNLSADLNKYDLETQRAIINTSSGTSHAIQRTFMEGVEEANFKPSAKTAVQNFIKSQEQAFKTGKIDFKDYIKNAGTAMTKDIGQYLPQFSDKASELFQAGIFKDSASASKWMRQASISQFAKQEFQRQFTELDKQGNRRLNNHAIRNIQKDPTWAKKTMDDFRAQGSGNVDLGLQKFVGLKGYEKVANNFSAVGAGITSAGMALNSFSAQLSSMGADKAAAAISGLGSAFTTVGMAASGAGSLVTTFSEHLKGGLIGLGIGAAVAGIVAAYKLHQKHIREIRDEGKKVTKDYQKNAVEQKKSLSELTSSYDEYQKLRKGVDIRGNNVSLNEEEYERYQEITDNLIKMNGALQQGVNKSGKAYISQSADIQKALQAENKEIERAQQKYLTNLSGQKIIDQVGTYKRVQGLFNPKDINGEQKEATNTGVRRGIHGSSTGKDAIQNAGKFTKSALEMKGAIDKLGLSATELKDLGLDKINWNNIDAFDAKKITDSAEALSAYASASDKLTKTEKEKITKSTGDIAKTYNDAVEATKDVTDWLEVYLNSTGMDAASIEKIISDKFDLKKLKNKEADSHLASLGKDQANSLVGGFREGLEQLSIQGYNEGWTSEEYKQKATDYAKSLKDLSSSATINGKQYADALTGIAEAQAKYDSKMADGANPEEAAKKYRSAIETEVMALDSLANQYEDAAAKGDIGAGLIAESIRNGMEKAVSYTTASEQQITESLNVLSDSFNSANSALENYQNQTKDLKDYYTAAEGMKTILDDIGWDDSKGKLVGKDVEGHGSQKFWLAAENLVDEKVLDKGINATKKKIQEIAPTLQEGEKGYNNFIKLLNKNKDKIGEYFKVDDKGFYHFEHLDDSSIKKMANQLGVADDYLSSMINKSRQFENWNTSDTGKLLASIKKSEGTIRGNLFDKKGQSSEQFFYNYNQLWSEAKSVGVSSSEFKNIIKDLQNKGIRLLDIDKLTSGTKKEKKEQAKIATDLLKSQDKNFKANEKLGNADLERFIKPIAKSGQYSADETLSILQAAGSIGTTDNDVERFSTIWDKLNASPELEATNQVAENTAQANSYLAEIAAASGALPKEVKDGLESNKKEIYGEKDKDDTWYQKAGKKGQNENGNALTYDEKIAGLTQVDTKRRELQEQLNNAEIALANAKTKKQKEEALQAQKTANDLLKSLDYYQTHGLAGTSTAEALLGYNAANFKFDKFTTEKDFIGLNTLDQELGKYKPEDINFKNISGLLQSITELGNEQKASIMGQYARQQMYDNGVEDIKGKKISNVALGSALNASDVDSFIKLVNSDSLNKIQKYPAALNQLKNQFAEIQGMDFFSADFWDLSSRLGTFDSDKKASQIFEKLGGAEGIQQKISFIADDENVKNAINNIDNDADKIKVIDALINLHEGTDTEKAKQTISDLLDKDGAEAVIKAVMDASEAEKTDKNLQKDGNKNIKVTEDATEAEKTNKELTKEEEKTIVPSFGSDNNLVNFFTGQPIEVPAFFKPQSDEVESAEEKIKATTLEVSTLFVPNTDKVDNASNKIQNKTVVQTVKQAATTIKANADTGGAKSQINDAAKDRKATIEVGANTQSALSMTKSAIEKINSSKGNVQVGATLSSSFNSVLASAKQKVESIMAKLKVWTGRNNHRMGAYSTGYNSISLHSYASGKKRTTKGNTVSALTGELGPEMAWYPKEGRAELLGVGGPQYVPDLPKDSVIWNARQTDKILNRKSIPIGSYSGGAKTSPRKLPSGTGTGTKAKSTSKKSSKDSSSKSTAEIAQTTGKINSVDVGIYNLTKKIEATSHKIEKNSDAIKTKLNKTIDFSYSQIKSLIGDQSTQLTKLANQNTSLSGKYTDKLNSLDKGTDKYKKYEVSYEKTTKKKGKKTTKSTKKKVNLGKYIKRDPDTGAYQVDEAALNKLAKSKKGGKKLAEAVLEAAKKEIDDLTSKQLSADKAAQDAKNKLQELRDELKETLFAWENELTEIKDLETKISLGDSFSKTVDSLKELATKMASPDLSNLTKLSTSYQRAVNANIEATRNQISLQKELRDAYKAELKSDLDLTDEYNNLTTAKNQLKAAQNSKNQGAIEKAMALVSQREDELDAAQVGKRLLSTSVNEYGQITVSFDWDNLEKQRVAGDVNKTEYEAVKKYYEKVVSDVEKINDTNAEIANKIGSLYEQRNEQYQLMSDYTQKIREGMEEEEQRTIDNLSDLNKSIQDAFKDLIDKVKKELDRQRKAEQNQKDEEEISNKVNRLAMLRADTAGSNAAEIAQLEKELSETTGKYEDSLEDQLLDRLQDQADEAAKQREKQIELLTAQLKYSKSAGIYLAKAEGLVEKISNGTATSEELKLAQLYYLSSDKLLDKWGKELEKINFASETLKVENFNSSIEAFEQAIKDYQKAAEELLDMALNGDSEYVSQNLAQIKKEVKDNAKNTNIKDAYNKLKNEGGLDNTDALTYLKSVGYTPKDFKDAGYSASTAKTAGFSASQLKSGGYTGKQIHDAGYTVTQFKDAKYSAADAKKAGYTAKQVRSAYTIKEFKNASYSAQDALSAGYSRKEVINTYGAAAVKKAEAGSTKTATLDKNGKKKGGKLTSGTVNSSGTKVAKQSGGAVYVQNYNVNTGKGTGATKKVAFKDFNTSFIKQNQKEAGKELVYQLKNKKVGTKLHKNWKSLVNASTYSGLKDGTQIALKGTKYDKKGTLVKKSGNVHYHDNTGVKYWNPTSGKLAYDLKYNSKKSSQNKNAFLNQALKNSGISREYAQFLIHKKLFTKKQLQNKGVKQFRTGGLADFTGPAWLDGTPSKPELVLNSAETKNFVALKDVLSEATKRGVFNHDEADNSGDINLDIDINVDKIDSDYDVDQIANRVKKIIIKEAKTRNVTVTGRAR